MLSLLAFAGLTGVALGGDCKWTAGGKTLDLSSLKGSQIDLGTKGSFAYTWSPCSDAIMCNAVGNMAMQQNVNNGMCHAIAHWDSGSINPSYLPSTKGFFFEYPNGDESGCPNKRILQLNLICGTQENNSPEVMIEEPSTCTYKYDITFKAACAKDGGDDDSSGGGGDDDDELSGGSVLLIILFVGIFLYFSIGCVYMKVKHNPEGSWADVKTNTPCGSFWMNSHKYVMEGCFVTKRFIEEKTRKDGGYEQQSDDVDI